MKTVKEQVKERIKDLLQNKQKELAEIYEKQNEAIAEREAARLGVTSATAEMDLERYKSEKEKETQAQTAADMYAARYQQIKRQEYVTEEESNKVIDSLLAYEEEIKAAFEQAIREPLKKLDKLAADYLQEVRETEETITIWTTEIHANYDNRGTTLYYDEFTDSYTSRSKYPIKVHSTPYTGSGAATVIMEMITGKLAWILEDPQE